MIDIKELQLGCHVSYKKKKYVIVGITPSAIMLQGNDGDAVFCGADDIQPIAVTTELLKKMGFDYNRREKCWLKRINREVGSDVIIGMECDEFKNWYYHTGDGLMIFKFMHQLESIVYLDYHIVLV